LRLILLDAAAVDLLCGEGPSHANRDPEIWIEVGGSHRVIQRCENDLARLASSVDATLSRREGAEAAWNCLSDLPAWLGQKHPDLLDLKVALPIAASEEFLSVAQKQSDGVRTAAFGQVGVGITHLCVLPEKPGEGVEALVASLRKTAATLGGTLVVEHCPTEIKERVDVWGPIGDDFEAMRGMKAVWDPKGTLAPGRFVGGL
jgi:FAD/FMN-containing dehydrogenase